jgi:hypothetical protein
MSESHSPFQHLLGVFVVLHVVAITLMAAPAPSGGMARSAWKDPTVQAEFAAWTVRLNQLGIDVTAAQVEDQAWEVATAVMSKRRAMLAPFMPYYTYMGTWQSWRMFVAPHRFPSRLSIDISHSEGRQTATWEPLYVARDRKLNWHADQLDHDRMRAAVFRYGWKSYRRAYREFGVWTARQVAQEQADIKWIRIRLYRFETASPDQVLTDQRPSGKYHSTLIFDVDRYR